MEFIIVTDTAANLPEKIVKEMNIALISLDYIVDGKLYKSIENSSSEDLKNFYTLLRQKKDASTSCINEEDCRVAFSSLLDEGKDIIYIAFSSALSASYKNAVNVAEQLKPLYPNRKIAVIDSRCASLGQGLCVYDACNYAASGKSFEQVVEYVEREKMRINHLFTVDDLYFLYKGGRVKATSYYMANLVKIKPVLRCDENGALVLFGKALGRKMAINTLISKLLDKIEEPEEQTIFISHGDCMGDIEDVIQKLRAKINVKDVIINYIDPVIGAHSGPDTIAIFFKGKDRSIS